MPVRCIVEINHETKKPTKQIIFEGTRECFEELQELSDLLKGASMKLRVLEWKRWRELKAKVIKGPIK